ncbi:MAG: glycosyltransferase [bacterium]
MKTEYVSIITPTYNSENVIGQCLEAIAVQDYPKDMFEVIIADAGSKDKTLEIINSFKDRLNITIYENPLKTGEAGKSVALEKAKGGIVALIDSDNVMPDSTFISKMVKPFEEDAEIIGTEPLYFESRKQEAPLTRYFALAGINDPLCLFIGNYDRHSYITGKWTGLDLKVEDKGGYLKINLEASKMPTIGANGTFMKKALLLKTNYKPYLFDIDSVYEIVEQGYTKFAKVKTGIVHIYSPSLSIFVKKQNRRISDFMHFNKAQQRVYPWKKFPIKAVVWFAVCCLTVLPLLFQMVAGFIRKKTWVWIFHIAVCELTLLVYAWQFIKAKMIGKTAMKNRDNW